MPTTSGHLRRNLALKRKTAEIRIAEAEALMKRSSMPDSSEEMQKLFVEFSGMTTKLTASMNALQEIDDAWTALIDEFEDEADQKKEQDLYDTTAMNATNGYLLLIEQLEELKCEVDGFIAATKENLGRRESVSVFNQSNPSVSGAGFLNYPVKTSAKLPKLHLPVFDGEDPLSWEPWWKLFEANIHNQPINKVEKFSYLLPLLSKTAAATINGLSVTESNYDVAVKTLQERFEKPKSLLISVLYGRLKQLPISGKSSVDIRQTYDKCEAICRQLEEAGENLDANTSLSIDILGKFPEFVIKDLSRHYSIGHSATATDIRQAVRKLVTEVEDISDRLSRIRMATNQIPLNKSKSADTHWKAELAGKSSALSTLDCGTPHSPAKFQSAIGGCYFCDGEHFNSTCPTYPSAQSRLAQLRRRKRCEKCGRPNHEAANCRREVRCIYCRNNNHYTALCPITFPVGWKPRSVNPSSVKATDTTLAAKSSFGKSAMPKSEAKPRGSKTEAPVPESKQTNVTALNVGERSSLLTATTTIVNPTSGAEQKARLIFDSASHRSYITESLITKLGLESSDEEDLTISVFGTKRSLTISSKIVTIEALLPNGARKSVTAHSTPVITESSVLPGGLTEVDTACLRSMQQMLADDYFDSNGTVDILVGTEYFWDFIIGTKLNTSSGLTLILSSFGFMLAGRYNSSDEHETTSAMFCLTECSSRIQNSIGMVAATNRPAKSRELDVDDYWSLERLGIEDPEVTNDDRALSQFNETIEFKDGRYHMNWPWIDEKKPLLPTNYELASGRLKSLTKRFTSQNGELLSKYQDVIQQQLDAGIIETVSGNEVHRDNTTIHYLPHHPVVKNSSSTTKLRIVYDASARAKRDAVCLNDCIYRGPVFLPHLCEVLLRFRCYPVVIVGDVEKAFLQLALRNEARDATRFLWLKDISRAPTPQNIEIYRFCRVPFGVIASPFLLGATIQHHLRKYTDTNHTPCSITNHLAQSASKIARDIYVDNITAGATKAEETLCLQRDIVEIFRTAGMNVREFMSNSCEVLDGIDNERRSTQRVTKFLGLQWDSAADVISLSRRQLLNEKVTKRTILEQLASIFDPLGLYSPVLLPAKLIFQRLWELKLDWDQPIPGEIHRHWLNWQVQMRNLFDHKIPRLTTSLTESNSASIIVFCDASIKCYATTVYLRSRTDRAWISPLIFCKSRLAPKQKTITLPRLELLAVLIGTRAAKFVTNAIKPLFDEPMPISIFTDSEIVLSWLQTEKLLERFVRNQVDRIKTLTDVTYHHVNSEENPADYPTRGLTPSEIVSSQQWWHGPPFLQRAQSEWPITNVRPFNITSAYRNSDQVSPICHTFVVGRCNDEKIEKLFNVDIKRFSHYRKLLRVSVYVSRLLKIRVWNLLSVHTKANSERLNSFFSAFRESGAMTAAEIRNVKTQWIRAVQDTHFSEIVKAVKSRTPSAIVNQLGLKLDDGILRSHSRFENSEIPESTRVPILLPKQSYFTRLVILDYHYRLIHSGVAHTLGQLRHEFWIPQGRATVRKVISRCVICRKHRGAKFKLPSMPPWPREKMVAQPPFRSTGVDYLGPVRTKVAEAMYNMWICLFTCLTTRAIHLEIVSDCTAVEFLNCLIRFTSRRGTPRLIISDNAPQFRTTKGMLDRTWHKVFTDDLVTSHISNEGIEWRFTIELAPWQGGFYERLVGIVKITLKIAIGRRLLTWQQLVTLTAEVEAIANTRPITYIYGDIESRSAVLRPIDFLTDLPVCRPNIDFTDVDVKKLGEMGKRLVAYWKTRQKRMQSVWDVWYTEYLRSLRERGSSQHSKERNSIEKTPKINEIVLLKDADIPRGAWKLAKVLKLIPSGDGVIRAAELLLPNKVTIRRTLNFLYPLELDQSESETDHHASAGTSEETAPAATSEQYDYEFEGFSQEEVDRVMNEMQRFDQLSAPNHEISSMIISIIRNRRLIAEQTSALLSGLSKDPQPLSFPGQI